MISVTLRTMSAFSTAAEPNARTIAAVTSGWRAQRPVRAGRAPRAPGRPDRRLGRRVRVEVRAQVGLLLGHRLEQQPLLRGEVAVDGAERDVGRGGDVAHLHRVEAAVGREGERRVEDTPAPCGLAAGQRSGEFGGGHDRKSRTRFDFRRNDARAPGSAPWTCSTPPDRLFTGELPIESHHPFTVERRAGRDPAAASRSSTRSPTRRRSTPTTGWWSSTRAASSTPSRCTRRCGGGPGSRLDTAIFTHGHIDHVFGVELYEAEARDERMGAAACRRARARARTLRSVRSSPPATTPSSTSGSSRRPGLRWPRRVPLPRRDVPPRPRRSTVGGERFELHHARGETDDGTWVWAPGAQGRCSRATCSSGRRRTAATRRRCSATRATGRVAFRTMAALDAEVLLPGHGLPIVGADRVRQALDRRRRAARDDRSNRRSR